MPDEVEGSNQVKLQGVICSARDIFCLSAKLGILTCRIAAADSAGMARLVETCVTADWQLSPGLVLVTLHDNTNCSACPFIQLYVGTFASGSGPIGCVQLQQSVAWVWSCISKDSR